MPDAPLTNGNISFWYADMGGLPPRRPPLDGDRHADVCIVGAGYSGLWTAYYLKRADPGMTILVLEREFAGFGASGRNGGWLAGDFAWSRAKYATTAGPGPVRAMARELAATVDEVIAVATAEGIEADILRTDELTVATNPAQLERLRSELDSRIAWDGTDGGATLIDAAAARARIDLPGLRGALVSPGRARVQPAKLVHGLARAVERLGVTICEDTTVTRIARGIAQTTRGSVRAPVVLRLTEGFTATLPGHRRDWLPLNSAQIVTEPLPPDVWQQIGWRGHEILGDAAHSYFYAQRTRAGRIAIGSRGVPYRFGSGIDRDASADPETVRRLTGLLRRHFPAAAAARIDHAWCGVLGVPRDWCATVGLDPVTGLGWAGGYVGIGVATSNLAGRTLCDLVLRRDTGLTRLPWVNRRPRRWEPEPLRWLGVRGMYSLLHAADRAESRGGPPSRLAALGNRLTGR